VMRALERDLTQRYPTARAMARDLNAFVSASGIAAGLGDMSEMMEELFQRERAAKLDAVASVLQTGSDALVAGHKSGQRVVDATLAPTAAPIAPTAIHPPEPATIASSPGAVAAPFAAAPPAAAPTPAPMPMWVWPAAIGGALTVVLLGVLVIAMQRPPAPAAVPLGPSTDPARTALSPTPMPLSSPTIAPLGPSSPTAAIAPLTNPPPEALATPPPTSAPAPAPAPTEAPHVRTGPGTIAISVTGGWADIYVDGQLRGRTPRQLQVPAGRHDVELRPSGTSPGRHQTVNVRSGATSRVTAQL